MITLEKIEEAIKKNFIIDKSLDMEYETGIHQHRLKTSIASEGLRMRSAALVVFTGAAYFNGYTKKQIIEYLELNRKQVDGLLARFIQAHNECAFFEISQLYEDQTTNKMLIAKYKLVANALALQEPKNLFVSLSDLPH